MINIKEPLMKVEADGYLNESIQIKRAEAEKVRIFQRLDEEQ